MRCDTIDPPPRITYLRTQQYSTRSRFAFRRDTSHLGCAQLFDCFNAHRGPSQDSNNRFLDAHSRYHRVDRERTWIDLDTRPRRAWLFDSGCRLECRGRSAGFPVLGFGCRVPPGIAGLGAGQQVAVDPGPSDMCSWMGLGITWLKRYIWFGDTDCLSSRHLIHERYIFLREASHRVKVRRLRVSANQRWTASGTSSKMDQQMHTSCNDSRTKRPSMSPGSHTVHGRISWANLHPRA